MIRGSAEGLDGCARLLQSPVIFIGLFACRSGDICRCFLLATVACGAESYGQHMNHYDLFLRFPTPQHGVLKSEIFPIP